MIHTVKDFRVVNEAEVDVFLEFSCFFYNPTHVGNLISGSSAFSKSSLNIWKFLVHILLKSSLENFEHYFASIWNECNSVVVWTFLALPFFGIGMKTDIFQSGGQCWVFQIYWNNVKTLNSSTGVPSPPLALFIIMLPKAQFTSQSRMSISRWVTKSLWYSRSLRLLLCSSSV